MLSRRIALVNSDDLIDGISHDIALSFLKRRIEQAILLDCMQYKQLIEIKIMCLTQEFKHKQS
jgi:hypothetical protein